MMKKVSTSTTHIGADVKYSSLLRLRKVGFVGGVTHLPEDVTLEDLKRRITKLNNDSSVHGVLLQLPLPPHLKEYEVSDTVYIKQ